MMFPIPDIANGIEKTAEYIIGELKNKERGPYDGILGFS
jgi:hypothetical protein